MNYPHQTAENVESDEIKTHLTKPTFHLEVLDELTHEASVGAVPLASDPENRYPYAYPRDIACITRAWLKAVRADVNSDQCRERIVDTARFFLEVSDNGWWYQRYALNGEDRSIYVQEDNIAHGIHILSHAVLALVETDELENADVDFLDAIVSTIANALDVTESLYDPNAHLVESTTSIHEGCIESGYTLWVNCAFVKALRLAKEALSHLENEDVGDHFSNGTGADWNQDTLADQLRSLQRRLERGLERSFAVDGVTVPRRYTPEGKRDDRPDITLFAPFYFDLDDLFGENVDHAANRAATALVDPQLDGLQRFRGFYRDFEVHQHGGSGPWMQYTAWHAQYRFERGERGRGEEILKTIASYASEEGYIPEHLSTRDRFNAFLEHEWHTGLDYEKEFDPDVLRNVQFDRITEELDHMRQAYAEMEDALDEQEVISFAEPLAWCHAEFLTALLERNDKINSTRQ